MDFIVRELYLDIEISKIKGSQGGKEGGRKEGIKKQDHGKENVNMAMNIHQLYGLLKFRLASELHDTQSKREN